MLSDVFDKSTASYSVQEDRSGFVVEVVSPQAEVRQFALTEEEVELLSNGTMLLREGILIRRLGQALEFHVARPGVRPERRILGFVPLAKFKA